MKVTLISPDETISPRNLGHHFITAGIKHLISAACGPVSFNRLNMLSPDPPGMLSTLASSDLAVICGNPRFNMDHKKVYWDSGLFSDLTRSSSPRPLFIDAYPGSAHPDPTLSVPLQAKELLTVPKNIELLETLKKFALVIPRDELTNLLCALSHVPTFPLPDSSYLAPIAAGVTPLPKDTNSVILFRFTHNRSTLARLIVRASSLPSHLPFIYVATNEPDFTWFTRFAPGSPSITRAYTAKALLPILARSELVLSFRLHVAIPALALGCRVALAALDSREAACIPFEIPTYPVSKLLDLDTPISFGGVQRDPALMRLRFKDALTPILK